MSEPSLRTRIATIMDSRGKQPIISMATLLSGVSIIYGGAIRLRQELFRRGMLATRQLPCPVISVGNLTLGGTGKTPMVIHLAGLFRTWGYRPVILSRGYKGSAEKMGAVVSDGKTLLCDVRKAGDEPFLMACLLPAVPVMVGQDRYATGMEAIARFHPDVIIMDDGYQHLRIKRDLNILMMDARFPFGNSYLLPRGTLREPAAALQRADVVILTRSDGMTAQTRSEMVGLAHPRPVFASRHRPVVRRVLKAYDHLRSGFDCCNGSTKDLEGKVGFAFAGLGSNSAFFRAIREFGAELVGSMAFEDHHVYSHRDLARIVRSAKDSGAEFLITSDKDFVRLPPDGQFPKDLIVMGVNLNFGKQKGLWQDFIGRQITDLIER